MRRLSEVTPLTAKEQRELRTLQRKWATRRATARDMERCQSLERRQAIADAEQRGDLTPKAT